MSFVFANMPCAACRLECEHLTPHPCFATGPLAMLLVCGKCLSWLLTEWPLDEKGKHQWCRVCAVESDTIPELEKAAGLSEGELAVLRTSGELDDNGAALYTCDACPSAFCSVCLMRLFSVGAIAEANTAAPWACPDCTKRELA